MTTEKDKPKEEKEVKTHFRGPGEWRSQARRLEEEEGEESE